MTGLPMTYLQVLIDTGEADRELSNLLTASSRGYNEALESEANRIAESLTSLSIQGTLVVAGSSESPETWMTRGLSVVYETSEAPTPLDISEWIIDRTGAARLDMSSPEASIDLRELAFSLPLGSLAQQVFLRGADITDTSSATVSAFRDAIGCTELSTWVTSHPEVSTTCDSTCIQSACNRALGIAAHKIGVAAIELNTNHNQIGLSGTLIALDEDDDRYPESITTTTLEGAWATSASPYGHDIIGSLSALRSSSF